MLTSIALLGFVTLQRLAELVHSRRNTARLLARGAQEVAPEHYMYMVALHATWLVGLWLLAPARPIEAFWFAGFAVAQIARLWELATLKTRWTTRIVVQPIFLIHGDAEDAELAELAPACHRRSLVTMGCDGRLANERRRLPGPAFPSGRPPPVMLRTHPLPDGSFRLDLPDGTVHAALTEDEAGSLLLFDGVSRRLMVVRRGAELTVILAGRNHVLVQEDPLAPPRTETAGSDRVTAPVPGRVTRVLVRPGDVVEKNAPLVVIEAMKMELTLRAPLDGTVEQVRHAVDDMVEEGTELVTFAAEAQQP